MKPGMLHREVSPPAAGVAGREVGGVLVPCHLLVGAEPASHRSAGRVARFLPWPCRGVGRSGHNARREGGGAGGADGDLARAAAQPGVALALLAALGGGHRTGGRTGTADPGHQVGGSREPGHVQADLGDDRAAMSLLMPGISASRWTEGSTGPSGLVLASGPVVPSALMPQAAGIAAVSSSASSPPGSRARL